MKSLPAIAAAAPSFSSSVSTITYPATPTGLTALATGPQSTSVSWSTATGATSTRCNARSHRPGLGRRSIPARRHPTPTAGWQSGTTYYYEILAGNSSGILVFVTLLHDNVPDNPNGTDCLGDRATVDLRKLEHGDRRHLIHAATRDFIRRALDAGLFRLSTSYPDSSVQSGTTYCYEVLAGNSSGNSAYSSAVSSNAVADCVRLRARATIRRSRRFQLPSPARPRISAGPV